MDKPYAGIYDTFMLPNNNPDKEVRLAELVKAIKMVYASTYKKTAQAYLFTFVKFYFFNFWFFNINFWLKGRYENSSGTRPEEAKMAVVIQQLAGHEHANNQFFPSMQKKYTKFIK